MDLSVNFLGTGGSVPSARRSTASVLVARGGERLLFDCGEGTQRQMQRSLGLVQADEIYLTHFHADHVLGLPGLLKTYDLTDRQVPLTIYGPPGLRELFSVFGPLIGRTGFPVELVMPASVSEERKLIAAGYGAKITYSDPYEGSDGAIRLVRKMIAEQPDRYFYPDQYNNPANPLAHYQGTGAEILEQTGGRIGLFVAGLGTTGTFTGTARRLKEHDPRIRTIAVQPDDAFHGLEGLKHLPTAIVPGIWDAGLADDVWGAPTEPAYELARALAREEGLLVGHSCGAALWAVRELGRQGAAGIVVTIFPDGGDRYLSTGLYRFGRPAVRK